MCTAPPSFARSQSNDILPCNFRTCLSRCGLDSGPHPLHRYRSLLGSLTKEVQFQFQIPFALGCLASLPTSPNRSCTTVTCSFILASGTLSHPTFPARYGAPRTPVDLHNVFLATHNEVRCFPKLHTCYHNIWQRVLIT